MKTPLNLAPREWGLLALALLFAALVRGLYYREASAQPSFAFPASDAAYHQYWGRALATGDWTPPPGQPDPEIRSTPYFRPPGYPFFLGFVYRVFGLNPAAPRVVQMLLGLVNVAFAFILGRKLYGTTAGFIFALFMGGYWSFPYFEAELLEPALLTPLTLLLLLALTGWLERPRPWKAAAAGLCVGIYALVRPTILLFPLLAPVWIAWRLWQYPDRRRESLLFLVLFWIATGAALLPPAMRNLAVAGDLVLVSSNGGVNLLVGNNPEASGLFNEPEEVRPFRSSFEYPDVVRRLEQRAGRPFQHSEASRFLSERATDYMRQDPRRTMRLVGRKTLLFWGPLEIGNNKEDHYERKHSPVLRTLPGNFTMALSFCLVGLAFHARRRANGVPSLAVQMVPPALLLVLAILLAHLPFFIAGRFRVPVLPILFLFGAAGLAAWGALLRERRTGEASLWLVGWLVLHIGLSANWTDYRPNEANYHYFRGVALAEAGRNRAALDELKQAHQLRPVHPPTLRMVSRLLLEEGRLEEAASVLDALIRLQPDHADALFQRGMLLGAAGHLEEAADLFLRVLELAPDRIEARASLAVALGTLGRFEEAVQHAENALAQGSGIPDAFREELRHRLAAYRAGRAYEGDAPRSGSRNAQAESEGQ